MLTENGWMPEKIKLEYPIDVDGELIEYAGFEKPVSAIEHHKICKSDVPDREQFYQLVKHSSDLDEKALNKLVGKDYNRLEQRMIEYVTKTSEFFFTEAGQEYPEGDRVKLLFPIENYRELDFIPPTLGMRRKRDDIQNKDGEFAAEIYVLENVTGVLRADLQKLSMPDFNLLRLRVHDFLEETPPLELMT